MGDKIEAVYEQARICPCGEKAISTYRVQGRNVISPMAYDKQTADQMARLYIELENLISDNEVLRDLVRDLKIKSSHDQESKNALEFIAKENADIANDRSEVIVNLTNALLEIVNKWYPALLRDRHEADKVDCNAQSIRSLIIRTLPGRNL